MWLISTLNEPTADLFTSNMKAQRPVHISETQHLAYLKKVWVQPHVSALIKPSAFCTRLYEEKTYCLRNIIKNGHLSFLEITSTDC